MEITPRNPKKIYYNEGYPSNTSMLIFSLMLEVIKIPDSQVDSKTKKRLMDSARAPFHICLN